MSLLPQTAIESSGWILRIIVQQALFPFFANRLLDPSRPEYKSFLAWAEFDPDNPPDPISILAVTEGKRATDSFEVFPCPSPDGAGDYVTKFFLRGLRHKKEDILVRVDSLTRGEELEAMPEDDNQFDPNAVAVVTADGDEIGYVPRYLAFDIRDLLDKCDFMSVTVERVNKDAPFQQRVLCCLKSCWPPGFAPCSREEFKPLASSASQTA